MVAIPTARDALSDWKLILSPETDLLVAIERLVRKRAHGAAVVDESGRLLGVLTEKDCLRLVANSAYGELASGRVEQYMSTVKATLRSDMDLFAMADVFLKGNFPVLPVLDGERLIGRVSRTDLLLQACKLEQALARARKREELDYDTRQRPTSIERLQRLAGSHSPEQLAEVLRNRPRYPSGK